MSISSDSSVSPVSSASERPTALVTGGGSGLGRAIAVALARRGCAVALVDLKAEGAAETAALCEEADVPVLSGAADLTQRGAPEAAVARVVEAWGRLDVLVNNAGYGGIEGFLDMTFDLWERTLAINLRSLALATAAAGRVMKVQGSGRIINITSPASRMALPNYTAYAASKAGVDAVTRAAAVALAPFGVRVNSIAPGMMDTEMQRLTELAMAKLDGRTDFETFLAERTARIPIGKRVATETVAEAVVWLALDAPDYVTAERLNISGGLDRD